MCLIVWATLRGVSGFGYWDSGEVESRKFAHVDSGVLHFLGKTTVFVGVWGVDFGQQTSIFPRLAPGVLLSFMICVCG
jgi:hypothetical protein